jgi:hypothetical protein
VEYLLHQHNRDRVDSQAPVQHTIHCPLVERDST